MKIKNFSLFKLGTLSFFICAVLVAIEQTAIKKDLTIIIGAVVGLIVSLINFKILSLAMDLLITENEKTKAFLIHLGRLFIFGATAVASYLIIGEHAIMGYGLGVISMPPAILILSMKGGRSC